MHRYTYIYTHTLNDPKLETNMELISDFLKYKNH
jgi:hypothetical protein